MSKIIMGFITQKRKKKVKILFFVALIALIYVVAASIAPFFGIAGFLSFGRTACIIICPLSCVLATALNLQEICATMSGELKEKMPTIKKMFMIYGIVLLVVGIVCYLIKDLCANPEIYYNSPRLFAIMRVLLNSFFLICILFSGFCCGISIYLQIRYNYGDNARIWKMTAMIICGAFCFISIFSTFALPTSNSSNSTYTCEVCERSFKAGTNNSKSIIETGMCKQCKENYDWATGD